MQSLGWVPEHDVRFDRVHQTTPFFQDIERKAENMWGIFDHSAIKDTLNDFAKMCTQYHVRLFVMFNPMPWQAIVNDENLITAEKELAEFQRQNPAVVFLTKQLSRVSPTTISRTKHHQREFIIVDTQSRASRIRSQQLTSIG